MDLAWPPAKQRQVGFDFGGCHQDQIVGVLGRAVSPTGQRRTGRQGPPSVVADDSLVRSAGNAWAVRSVRRRPGPHRSAVLRALPAAPGGRQQPIPRRASADRAATGPGLPDSPAPKVDRGRTVRRVRRRPGPRRPAVLRRLPAPGGRADPGASEAPAGAAVTYAEPVTADQSDGPHRIR